MEDQTELLRRRIVHYRRRLREGTDAELARIYLIELGKAQLELEELEAAQHGEEKRNA